MRRKEPRNLNNDQTEALKIEKSGKELGKSEILGFNRGPSNSHESNGNVEAKEVDKDPIKE